MRVMRILKLVAAGLCLGAFGALAEDGVPAKEMAALEAALVEAKEGSSAARQRLAVRRTVRDAEELLEAHGDSPDRFKILEFLFRARQQLIALDDDSKHRDALLETARELVKAPAEFAELRLEADLLLSQADLAKQGANAEVRAEALRPFVERYLDTPVGAKVVRLAMVMALELGDNQLVTDLRTLIEERFAADLEMISFQRDKLGGQVFGAPFVGTFERSDGKVVRYPMDGLGRSTMFLFWSKEDRGEEILKALASAYLETEKELAGRLEIISVNLDELPDAGESIVRGHGVDWQVLRFPDGRENPIYKAYVRWDPSRVTVSPTGQAAMIMTGSTRKRTGSDGTPDYARMFGSTLARSWTKPRYVQQLGSLLAGDFLVLDSMGGIDPVRPPELKALAGAKPLARSATSVPEETLQAIQDCFVPPPLRFRQDNAEARESYQKAVDLCRQAISAHPEAPDLWIVRNRLMVALLGLWKTDSDLARLEEAIVEAKTAMAAGYPKGADVVPRFCLAREALRDADADAQAVIDTLVSESGGESASGPALAAAAIMSLEVADRSGFERYREALLKHHIENPMMWTFNAFLLDRYHRYWLFQVPFTAGWSYGRRQAYFMSLGTPEDAGRTLETELKTLEGEAFRIPENTKGKWTALLFAPAGPWSTKRDDGLPPSADRAASTVINYAENRGIKDLEVILAVFDDDAEKVKAYLPEKRADCPVMLVPGGLDNPLVQRLGILSEDERTNSVLISPEGTVTVMISGLTATTKGGERIIGHVIEWQDEEAVSDLLEQEKVEEAKELIFTLAPPFDPEAKDERGRPLKKPRYSLAHLRARARVYIALEEWDKALADAEEVVQRQLGTDGGMSLRTDELDQSEKLRETIRELSGKSE